MRKKHDQLSAVEVSPAQQTPPLLIAAPRSQCQVRPCSSRLYRPCNRCGMPAQYVHARSSVGRRGVGWRGGTIENFVLRPGTLATQTR